MSVRAPYLVIGAAFTVVEDGVLNVATPDSSRQLPVAVLLAAVADLWLEVHTEAGLIFELRAHILGPLSRLAFQATTKPGWGR